MHLIMALVFLLADGWPQVGETIAVTRPPAWKTAIQDSAGGRYRATGAGNFVPDSRRGQQAKVIVVQFSADQPDDPVDIVVEFYDGGIGITSGTRVSTPGKLSVNRGFRSLDVAEQKAAGQPDERQRVALLEAENAKEARAAKYEGVRIWHDTETDVVRGEATGSWYVSCKDDRVDDQRSCTASPIGLNFVSVVVRNTVTPLAAGVNKY